MVVIPWRPVSKGFVSLRGAHGNESDYELSLRSSASCAGFWFAGPSDDPGLVYLWVPLSHVCLHVLALFGEEPCNLFGLLDGS